MNGNPLYERLVRDQSMPRAPGPIGLALMVAAATLLLHQVNGPTSTREYWLVTGLSAAVLFISPIFSAGYAAALAASQVNKSEYAMMRLTTLTPAEVVRAFLFAALYRLQMLYAVIVGLIPLLYVLILQNVFARWTWGVPGGTLGNAVFLLTLIALAVVNLSALAVGIVLGLKVRNPVGAALIAVTIFAILPVLPFLPTLLVGLAAPTILSLYQASLLAFLTWPLLKLAERWV